MSEFSRERFREIPSTSLEEIYINKTLQRALQAMEIDPKECGVFLDRTGGGIELRTIDFHHRTVDRKLSSPLQVTTKTSDRVYAHFDFKGVGFISPESHESKKENIQRGSLADAEEIYVIPGSTENPWGYDVLGLFDERMVKTAVFWADRLASKGFRGEAIAAAYRLKHVWVGGKQQTIGQFVREQGQRFRNEAKETNDPDQRNLYTSMATDIENNFSPALVVRCMRSVFRIRDLIDAHVALAKPILREVIDNLKQESIALGKSLPNFTVDSPDGLVDYTKSITEWIGHNLGILQREGLRHNYLHMGNISLAGEIVDLDSIEKVLQNSGGGVRFAKDITSDWQNIDEEYKIPLVLLKDVRDSVVSCKKFIKHIKKLGYSTPSKESLSDSFLKSWRRAMNKSEIYSPVGTSFESLNSAVENMVYKGIRDGVGIARLSDY